MSNGSSSRKNAKKNLNRIYSKPLPVEIRPYPVLDLKNPNTWVSFVRELIFPEPVPEIEPMNCLVIRHGRMTIIRVDNADDQQRLWREGFFGKGVYSRSDPSWYARTARRLNLEEAMHLPMTAEENTNARRAERVLFKEVRANLEKENLERIRRKEQGEEGVEVIPASEMASIAREMVKDKTAPKKPTEISALNSADRALLDDSGKLVNIEYVQLMPYEAIFLSEFLGVLNVIPEKSSLALHGWDLVNTISCGQMLERFIAYYAAYHHYRSHGWCARSGVKFAADFVLYRRGPPFQHADFTVTVIPVFPNGQEDTLDWHENTRWGRVIGGVRKTTIYCYVELPDLDYQAHSLRSVLESCKVTDVSHKRWRAVANR